MIFSQYPIHRHVLRVVGLLSRSALCGAFIFGTTTLQANELSFNELCYDEGVHGDFDTSSQLYSSTIRELSLSFEIGEKSYIELARATGGSGRDADIYGVSVGVFENSSATTSVYGQFAVLLDKDLSSTPEFGAAFGVRKLLSPYVELSPWFSLSSVVNQRQNYGYNYGSDEGHSINAAIGLALRIYPVNSISIDFTGIASKEAGGTTLGISWHF